MKFKIVSFFILFLYFLPFTQALTIDILFPLKISEILLVFIFLFGLLTYKVPLSVIKILKRNIILLCFLSFVTISFLVNVFWKYPYPLKSVPTRVNVEIDSLLRLVYIYLNVFAYFLSIKYISKNPKLLDYWLKGGVLAAGYAWYIFSSSALNIPYLKLPGMEDLPQTLYGIVRSGTFKEGNFFGLFLILSAAISFYRGKVRLGWFFLISVITTLSTISLFSGLLLVMYLYRSFLFKKKILKTFLFLSPIIILSIVMFVQTNYFKVYVYNKIFQPVNVVTPGNFSKVDRYITGRIAFNQGLDNPILGVGPNNYALHYDHYNDYQDFLTNSTPWFDNFVARVNKKPIPNNIYMEIWSEYGILGLLLFLLFLIQIVLISFKNKDDSINGGILVMLFSFNAFPSFIMLFIWVFLAIPLSLNISDEERKY